MKLAARLWIFGALVPGLGMALAFLLAGHVLERSLDRGLDEALLAQATVEGVSLFDGAEGGIHLHMESSPLLEQVRPFAPVASVYGPDGALVLAFPRGALVPRTQAHLPRADVPALASEADRRVLRVTLRAPGDGALHTLRLEADRTGIRHTLARYRWTTGSLTLLFALALALFQAHQARSLGARVARLVGYLRQVGRGELASPPPADDARDEVGALRDEIAAAAGELRRSRDARERLLANAAHELRTPLASMRTALDLALRRERSGAELREALLETREEVDRLALLATRLLERSTSQLRREVGPVDLREIADAAAAAVRATAAERGIDVRVDGDAPPVEGDAAALRRAVDNGVDNALKFSPRGGTIRLRLDGDAERVSLVVADDGPGVPPAEREAVFEPFHRADVRVPGTGLGLALVREILEAHRGAAYFAPGAGARLVLEVPRKAPAIERKRAASRRPSSGAAVQRQDQE